MHLDLGKASEAGVAMPMQFLAVGKAPLHCLLTPFVDGFAFVLVAMFVDYIFISLPDMARHRFGMVATGGALPEKAAVAAN